MDRSNLTSAFIGAIIALVVSEFWKFVVRKTKIAEERDVFKEYLGYSILEMLEKYKIDIGKAQRKINDYPLTDMMGNYDVYDVNPLLNSGIFKEIGFNRLYQLVEDYKTHNDIIDLYHMIEYLTSERPIDTVNIFLENYNKTNWQGPDLGIGEEEIKYINDNKVKRLKHFSISTLEQRQSAIDNAINLTKDIIEKLR